LHTNKELLLKGLKFLAYTVALMFSAPVVLFQAFKNQEHPFYIVVLILGIILAIAAIVMGFYSIKTVIDALFGKKK
jgi:DMSO reductase anchor subunit